MRVVTDLPRRVRTISTEWITLADGCRLAARIWLPDDAGAHPVPAIFEFLPYRLNDGTAVRDSRHFPYLAGHGYGCVRVDIRGTGESDGLLDDEYLPQEQSDACEVIAWIAAQPWCTGAVGMIGISWSGFNSLQVAAHRPPALRAIVTLCSTDDRYADDVHYDGGCVGSDMLQWASSMLGWNGWPPDPAIVGERWRDMWLERLGSAPPMIEPWLGHQRRDAYWKQGSVCEDYSRIDAAVYAVGWLVGRLHERDPAAPRRPARPAQGPDRPVGARLAPGGAAWPDDRVPAGGAALVRPLARRRRHRDHGRADAAGLHPGLEPARRPVTPSGPGGGWPSPPGPRPA